MTVGRFPACAACGGPEARTSIGDVSLCDGCLNASLSARTGWPSLPAPPAVETLRAGDGREVRIRYRLTWTPSGLISAEAEEAELPPGDGFRFVVYGGQEEDPQEVLARLRRIVQREVAHAYLEASEAGAERWAIAGDEVVGRVDWSGDEAVDEPSVVVDGRRLTWETFGRLVASFEGWGFRMRFDGSSDGLVDGVDGADAEGSGDGAPDQDDRADAEVVPLFGPRGAASAAGPEGPSIDAVLAAFLAEQEARLAASTFARYDDIVDLLRLCLNSYGHTSLSGRDAQVWQEAFDAGDDEAFTRLFGPERIVEGYGEFLGYFLVRKVAASKQQLKDAGTVTKRLARWLAEQGYVAPDIAEVARGRAADAGRELPRADGLAEQLFLQAQRTRLPVHPDDIADEDWVEDLLPITRVEDGRLWFDHLGPVEVPTAASDLAEVGWEVSVVLARLDGTWRLVEVGAVYP
jgi:hypothetical protein